MDRPNPVVLLVESLGKGLQLELPNPHPIVLRIMLVIKKPRLYFPKKKLRQTGNYHSPTCKRCRNKYLYVTALHIR